MIKFRDYTPKEIFLFSSSFLMLIILVLRDQLISPFILLFFIATLYFMKGRKVKAGRSIAAILMFFYSLHVVSLLYSDNLEYAGADLMTKLSYLIFPLFIVFIREGYELIMRGIRWGLIVGSGISMLFSLIRAFIIEGAFSGVAFDANNYGLNMHPSYLTLIFIISCALFWNEKINLRGVLFIKIGFGALVVLSMFYLRSLGAFACVASILLILPVWKAMKSKNWKWYFFLPVYAFVFVIGVKSSPRIANDVNSSLTSFNSWLKSPEQYLLDNKNDLESNTVRLVTWTLSSRILHEHPFGVGIGDVKDVLNTSYRRYGYTYYAYRELNPHNQFLQTGIALGWLGICALFLIFIVMLYYAFTFNNLALFIAALCILVSCLFESLLERQVGVILMAVLIMYISFFMRDKMNYQPVILDE